ncbi:hypothetical protein [Flavobacterium microcysteis]
MPNNNLISPLWPIVSANVQQNNTIESYRNVLWEYNYLLFRWNYF